MTNDTADRPDPHSAGRTGGEAPPTLYRRRWVALVIVLVAGFMDLLDVTIVNVAIPSILNDLEAQYSQIEWIIAAYVLAFAALLITGGRLGDIYGRKRIFLIGMGGFTIASALCGFAVSPEMLIASRFLQGAMAGLMVPQILAIIQVTFPREERGKAFGMFGGIVGSASAVGLIAGALLVEADLWGLQWRPIFLVNVPIGLVTMLVAAVVVPESRSRAAPRLDLIGMVLAISAVLMLVYPLTEGRRLGWPSWTLWLMAGSAAMLALFVAYERWRTRTVGSPLVELGLFRARPFSFGMAIYLIFWIALGAFFLAWTLYMQVGLGWQPLRAGLTALGYAFGAATGASLSVALLAPRFGRSVLMVGALLNAAGFVGYSWLVVHYGPGIHSWTMVPALVVAGFGFGLVVAPMIDLILTDVPVREAGSASGLLTTTQQVGMALGVALIGVVFLALLDRGSGDAVDEATPGLRGQLTAIGVPPAAQDGIIARFRACVQERSAATDPTDIPASCQPPPAAPGQPPPAQLQEILTRAGLQANAYNFSRAFGTTLWYAAGVMILVLLGLFALPHRMRARDLDAELSALDDMRVGQPETSATPSSRGVGRE